MIKKAHLIFIFSLFLLSANAQKLMDRGLAEMIVDRKKTHKALALHYDIPVGTQVILRNPANGRETEVRIIGRLPRTGNNSKLIMKISEAAAIDLNITGKRFAIEIYPYTEDFENRNIVKRKPQKKPIVRKKPIKKKPIIDNKHHRVKKGETLYGIAKKYGVSIKQLQTWNNLNGYAIKEAQVLKIAD